MPQPTLFINTCLFDLFHIVEKWITQQQLQVCASVAYTIKTTDQHLNAMYSVDDD